MLVGTGRTGCARGGAAFSLIEMLFVLVIVSTLIALLLPAISRARGIARDVVCKSNMRQLGLAGASYATDAGDSIPSFSWEPGSRPSRWEPLNNRMNTPRSDSLDGAQSQATDILRRRSGRGDELKHNTIRYPHRRFSHLVLLDYMSVPLPDPRAACPEDRDLIRWASDPTDLSTVPTASDQDSSTETRIEIRQRWAYSSTYQAVPASWSPDTRVGDMLTVGPVERYYNLFTRIDRGLRLGNRKLSEVNFPGAKVFMFEYHDRHSSDKAIFYAYPVARSNLLFFDNSVRAELTEGSNPGFDPNNPSGVAPAVIYDPAPGAADPPPLYNPDGDTLKGHYRWTRDGLRGVDFGGAEVRTGSNG